MNRWVKRLLAAGLAVALLLVGLLFSLAIIANARGVRSVVAPAPSLIAIRAVGADYLDAYRVTASPERLRNLDDVVVAAFQKGDEVARSATEVVYTGCAPGLVFDVAYQLTHESDNPVLTMTTAVRYTSGTGRLYFAIVRPIHRRLVPFMVSRMAR